MKPFTAILATLMIFTLLFSISCNSSNDPVKQSLKKASETVGIEIPWPHYLPEGYEISRNIIAERENVTMFITNGAIQIKLNVYWRPLGIIPYRVVSSNPTIEINGITGQLEIDEEKTHIIWNWYPEKYEPGLIIVQLFAPKNVSLDELVSIAESINWD